MYGKNEVRAARFLDTGTLVSAGRALRRLGHKMAECRRNRRAHHELAAMSDRELEDIGILRSDIDAIFTGRYDSPRLDSSTAEAFDRRRYREPPVSTRRRSDAAANPRIRQ